MNRIAAVVAALLAVLFCTSNADAQLAVAKVVASCGTVSPTPVAGTTYSLTMDTTGTLCTGLGGGTVPLPANAAQETGGNLAIAAAGLAPSSSAWGGSGTLTQVNSGIQALYNELQLGVKTAGAANAANSVQTEPYTGGEIDHGGTTASASAITVLPASGVAGIREYMTALQLARSDAGTTAITVACTDGTTTRTWVLPGNTGGQVINMTWPHPGLQWIVNHIVTCTPSTGVTNFYAWGAGFAAP